MELLTILAILGNGFVMLAVVELIRRGRLKERYSLLWLMSGSVLLVFSLSRGMLDYVSRLVGIYYPPSFLFLLAFAFLLLITMHFTVVISGLSDRNKKLAQELALLRLEVKKLQTAVGIRSGLSNVAGNTGKSAE